MIQNIDPNIIVIAGSIIFVCMFLFVLYLNLTNNKRILRFMNKVHTSFLQEGIGTTLVVDKNYYLDKIGKTVKETRDSVEAVFLIKDEKFDYIFYRSGGNSDCWEYIVLSDIQKGTITKTDWTSNIFCQRVTKLSVNMDKWLFGKVTNVSWKGDEDLSRILNLDNLLNARLAQLTRSNKLLRHMFIHWKNSFAIISIPVYTPSSEDFEIMNMISRHIKTAWYSS